MASNQRTRLATVRRIEPTPVSRTILELNRVVSVLRPELGAAEPSDDEFSHSKPSLLDYMPDFLDALGLTAPYRSLQDHFRDAPPSSRSTLSAMDWGIACCNHVFHYRPSSDNPFSAGVYEVVLYCPSCAVILVHMLSKFFVAKAISKLRRVHNEAGNRHRWLIRNKTDILERLERRQRALNNYLKRYSADDRNGFDVVFDVTRVWRETRRVGDREVLSFGWERTLGVGNSVEPFLVKEGSSSLPSRICRQFNIQVPGETHKNVEA